MSIRIPQAVRRLLLWLYIIDYEVDAPRVGERACRHCWCELVRVKTERGWVPASRCCLCHEVPWPIFLSKEQMHLLDYRRQSR